MSTSYLIIARITSVIRLRLCQVYQRQKSSRAESYTVRC